MSEEVEIFECEQNSPEWFELHRGVPTASQFADVMAGGDGKVRLRYMRVLAGEVVSGQVRETYSNGAMERGKLMEERMRARYAITSGKQLTRVGFVTRRMPWGIIGCSPDSLIDSDGVLEIKTNKPDLLIELMESGRGVPTKYLDQCQGALLVTGRQYCVLSVGYDGMPSLEWTLRRDEARIARLCVGLETFYRDLEQMVERVRERM